MDEAAPETGPWLVKVANVYIAMKLTAAGQPLLRFTDKREEAVRCDPRAEAERIIKQLHKDNRRVARIIPAKPPPAED